MIELSGITVAFGGVKPIVDLPLVWPQMSAVS